MLSEQIQPIQPYSIKLETTNKGIRISVHVYGPEGLSEANRAQAVQEAVRTFEDTVNLLGEKGYSSGAKGA